MIPFLKCWDSDEYAEQKKINQEIERQISKDRESQRGEIKLLLLGTGESGKSTFVKQMRIIHGTGYTEEDKIGFIRIVYQNILSSIQPIIRAMTCLDIEYERTVNIQKAEIVMTLNAETITTLQDRFVQYIKDLWLDTGVQGCYSRRREYQLSDSASYFLDSISRISAPDYIPTEQDILRLRIATSGIWEYVFQLPEVRMRIIDVGGQRSERRKWIHCFDHVTSIIYLVALSEYDQVLYEAQHVNRMRESKAMFTLVLEYPWFQEASIILFLNKTDIFEEKIVNTDLCDYFPEYFGPRRNAIKAREFILEMFLELNPDSQKKIYNHFTCATDTGNIRFVFESVKKTVLEHNLKQCGFL